MTRHIVVLTIILTFLLQLASSQLSADIVELSSIPHGLVDTETMTTSGLSSGGFMSIMFHYMFSSKIVGAGSFGGGPFGILYNVSSRNSLRKYLGNSILSIMPKVGRSVAQLERQAISLSKSGLIDPIINLNGSKAYVFQGGLDPVNPAFLQLSTKVTEMYNHFGSDVKDVYIPRATHCVPTDNYGGWCWFLDIFHSGLNNCGYEGIYDMFSHFYGDNYIKSNKSPGKSTGQFYDFDQNPFAPSGTASDDFLNYAGGIYVPAHCAPVDSVCKLHVAFHGCFQSVYSNIIDDTFAKRAGYFQVADANRVIVVFPRGSTANVKLGASAKTGLGVKSNFACWDWFGMTTDKPALKDLPQVRSVVRILNSLIGKPIFS